LLIRTGFGSLFLKFKIRLIFADIDIVRIYFFKVDFIPRTRRSLLNFLYKFLSFLRQKGPFLSLEKKSFLFFFLSKMQFNRLFSSTRQALQKLYVGNLNWQMSEDSLRKTFSKHGEILDAFIVRDRLTGKSRGFGFVEFADKENANAAKIELDGSQHEGRVLKVNLADEKPPRSRQ
jgi:hypothetical protein